MAADIIVAPSPDLRSAVLFAPAPKVMTGAIVAATRRSRRAPNNGDADIL